MANGPRKVIQIEVFDFESDTMAYNPESHKNQFGYKYQTSYIENGNIIRQTKEINNVEKGAIIYNILGINISQLRSLKRRVRYITKKGMFPFNEGNKVEVVIRGGSKITYQGKHKEEFYQKVLELKLGKNNV